MFKIIRRLHIGFYEYVYFFTMVIYMSYMTSGSRIMLGGMMEHPVAFCFPILLTIILILRNNISFANSFFLTTLGVIILWSLFHIITKHQYTPKLVANYLYYLYAIIIAYIHIQVYQKKLFYLYEDVIVKISFLSLIIWGFTSIMPEVAMQVANFFPKTTHGNNFLYLVHWISPVGKHVEYGMIRNAGSSWEPGRFAIMVCLAILINIYRKGVCIRNNKNVVILLITLITTMSTTGYVLAFFIYAYMYIQHIFSKYTLIFILIGIPMLYWGIQLNFIGEKLEEKMDIEKYVEHIEDSYEWTEEHAEGPIAYSMDRFPSFVFEYENFTHDPILGYGGNPQDSYFMKTKTTTIGFTGGLMTLFSRYGLIVALFLLFALYNSSIQLSADFHSKKKYGLLLCYIISMISYPLIWFPIYTAFWFYRPFQHDKK